jgi:replication initiation and membrane attachment protein DnaB
MYRERKPMSGATKQKQVRVTENVRAEIQKLAEAYGLKQQQIVTLAVRSLARQIHIDGGLTIKAQASENKSPSGDPRKAARKPTERQEARR